MAKTNLTDVNGQIKEFWAPMFMDELKEKTLLPSLVNKDYIGSIEKGGDTVYVSQINRPAGETRTVGVDADTFNSEKLSTQRVSIQANKRFQASFEFDDLVELQSQIGDQNSKIRRVLLESVEIQLNNYLYSLIAPSASSPSHVLTSVTNYNAAQLSAVRTLAAQSKWRKDGWYNLLDPVYYSDLMNATTMVSSDYGASDAPLIGGQVALKRFGFNVLEDDSAGLLTLSGSSADAGIAFHPDFMHLVMQKQPTYKVAELTSNHQHGFVIVVDAIGGASLGNDGDNKHISIINS